jgi:hypothetical protein
VNLNYSQSQTASHPELPQVPGGGTVIPGIGKTVFNLPRFIPLLRERMRTLNPFTRMFIIQWISILASIPDLELISYLADMLDGLFEYLSDPNADVRRATLHVLDDFLREIKHVVGIQMMRGHLNVKGRMRDAPVIEPAETGVPDQPEEILPFVAHEETPQQYPIVVRDDSAPGIEPVNDSTDNLAPILIAEDERASFETPSKTGTTGLSIDPLAAALREVTLMEGSSPDGAGGTIEMTAEQKNEAIESYAQYQNVILDIGKMVDTLGPYMLSTGMYFLMSLSLIL